MLYLLISQLKTTYKLFCIYFLSIKETIGGFYGIGGQDRTAMSEKDSLLITENILD